MSIKNAVKLIEESEARFVDLRFTDTKGKQHHFTVPARIVLEDPEEWFENGQAFDGSSIGGWKGIQASDMQLRPDASTAFVDPFMMMLPSSLPATSSTLPTVRVTTATRAPSPAAPKPI